MKQTRDTNNIIFSSIHNELQHHTPEPWTRLNPTKLPGALGCRQQLFGHFLSWKFHGGQTNSKRPSALAWDWGKLHVPTWWVNILELPPSRLAGFGSKGSPWRLLRQKHGNKWWRPSTRDFSHILNTPWLEDLKLVVLAETNEASTKTHQTKPLAIALKSLYNTYHTVL